MICMCTASQHSKVANAQMHNCLTAQLSKYIQLYKCRTLLTHAGIFTESQKPRQRVSNADRKVFANPESFCDNGHYWLKNFRILCTTKYPDNMQSVRMNWKVSGKSKKCPDNLENVSG